MAAFFCYFCALSVAVVESSWYYSGKQERFEARSQRRFAMLERDKFATLALDGEKFADDLCRKYRGNPSAASLRDLHLALGRYEETLNYLQHLQNDLAQGRVKAKAGELRQHLKDLGQLSGNAAGKSEPGEDFVPRPIPYPRPVSAGNAESAKGKKSGKEAEKSEKPGKKADKSKETDDDAEQGKGAPR